MKVRSAAQVGIILIIVNLIISLCTHGFYLMMYLPTMFQRGGNDLQAGGYLLASVGSILAEILLNTALLLVFGSLCRTREQFFRDNPDIPA
jgi:hypothetical protein